MMGKIDENAAHKPRFHLGYRPGLDGLRGFAVLWVIGFHYDLPLGRSGLFGVDIFFALSGFLITVLLLEEWQRSNQIRLKFFYLRRILRLFPAIVLLLAAFFAVAPKVYVVSTLFYFTNWIKALHLQPDSLYLDHVWSLSIEEQYYLFWPLFLLLLLRAKVSKPVLVLIPLALGLTSAVARILVWNASQDWFRVYMGTDLHADGLLLGSAFGVATVFGLLPDFNRWKRILTLLTGLTLLLALWLLIDKNLTQSFIPLYGNLGVSIGTIVLISRLVHAPAKFLAKIFCFPPLVKIGVISYGLYLWHAPIGVVIDQAALPWPAVAITVTKLVVTFLCAGASYMLVEKPILSFKDRFAASLPARA